MYYTTKLYHCMMSEKTVTLQYIVLYFPVCKLYIMYLLLYRYIVCDTGLSLYAGRTDINLSVHTYTVGQSCLSERIRPGIVHIYCKLFPHHRSQCGRTITLLYVFTVRLKYISLLPSSTWLHLYTVQKTSSNVTYTGDQKRYCTNPYRKVSQFFRTAR